MDLTVASMIVLCTVPVLLVVYHFTRIPPLHKAARCGDFRRLQDLLAEGADIERVTHLRRMRALHEAAARGHTRSLEILLHAGAALNVATRRRETPLLLAVRGEHEAGVRVLLKAGADPNVRAGDGSCPLLVAAECGHGGMVTALLDAAADIEVYGRNGAPPLIVAIQWQREQIVRLLLQRGANVNASIHHSGVTALIAAAIVGNDTIVAMLLGHGADATERRPQRGTALDYATEPRVVALLRQAARRESPIR